MLKYVLKMCLNNIFKHLLSDWGSIDWGSGITVVSIAVGQWVGGSQSEQSSEDNEEFHF